MRTTLFDYPKNAAFGRVLPKSKIYEHARPSAAIKTLFVRQVDQIIWQYKLAAETINIPGTPVVREIQVFGIVLKDGVTQTRGIALYRSGNSFPDPVLSFASRGK